VLPVVAWRPRVQLKLLDEPSDRMLISASPSAILDPCTYMQIPQELVEVVEVDIVVEVASSGSSGSSSAGNGSGTEVVVVVGAGQEGVPLVSQ